MSPSRTHLARPQHAASRSEPTVSRAAPARPPRSGWWGPGVGAGYFAPVAGTSGPVAEAEADRVAAASAGALGGGIASPETGPRPLPSGLPQDAQAGVAGPGVPLAPAMRAHLEPVVGAPLGGVRVHTGPRAVRAAEGLGAAAYTVGDHLVFGAGQYRPDTAVGRALVAHEAAHAVQQRHGPVRPALQAVSPGPGGTTSSTTPTYTIADVENDLRGLNAGPIRGDAILRQLTGGRWRVRFWNVRGRVGQTLEASRTIVLPPEGVRAANVSTLFHEAIHATRSIRGAGGPASSTVAVWANLEEEMRAQVAEVRFLVAHAHTHPNLIAESSFSDDFPRLTRLNRAQLFDYFKDEAMPLTILGKVTQYQSVLTFFGNNPATMAASTQAVAMLRRVFAMMWPWPSLQPPPPTRRQGPSLLPIRRDFNDRIIRSAEDL